MSTADYIRSKMRRVYCWKNTTKVERRPSTLTLYKSETSNLAVRGKKQLSHKPMQKFKALNQLTSRSQNRQNPTHKQNKKRNKHWSDQLEALLLLDRHKWDRTKGTGNDRTQCLRMWQAAGKNPAPVTAQGHATHMSISCSKNTFSGHMTVANRQDKRTWFQLIVFFCF